MPTGILRAHALILATNAVSIYLSLLPIYRVLECVDSISNKHNEVLMDHRMVLRHDRQIMVYENYSTIVNSGTEKTFLYSSNHNRIHV